MGNLVTSIDPEQPGPSNQTLTSLSLRSTFVYTHVPDAGNAPVFSKRRNHDEAGTLNSALKEVLESQGNQPPTVDILNSDGEFIKELINAMKESSEKFASLYAKRVLVVQTDFRSPGCNPTFKLWVYLKATSLTPICVVLPWIRLSVTTTTIHEEMIKWCNNENWVIPRKVHNWMKSLVDRALPSLEKIKHNMGIRNIMKSENEYSFILKLVLNNGTTAKLCIVPCLDIKKLASPVDKLSHGVIPSSYFSLQENNQWMVADVEAETFAPGTSAQQVYKLLLKLVEVKRWGSHIPNYLLQNVVKHENVLEHAKETSLGQAFIEALKVLQTALTSNQLPHYQKGWNLMTNLVPKNAPRAAMKSDIENIIKYSLTSPLWVENMLKGNRSPTPYPPLDKLDIIMKQTTMDDTLKQQNISVITKMVQLIVDNAQRDEIFESLFSRVEYTGSYYENLRVWTADEYDIDFIFNFPVYSFELVDVPQLSVYKKLRVPNVEEEYSKKAKFIKAKTKFLTFFSDSGFLLRDRFINWFNSIVDKVLLTFPLGQLKIKTIRRKKSGPAITWLVTLKDGEQIDVDLVPVFYFNHTEPFPCGIVKSKAPFLSDEDWSWVLVPKPLKQINSEEIWRAHLLSAEKRLLEKPKGCFRPTIRLVKLLRDTQGWKALSSYFIKSLAFHLWYQKRNEVNYWETSNMPCCLFEMLYLLKTYLKDRNLPSFFFPQYNLLSQIPSVQVWDQICTNLGNILPALALEPRPYFLPNHSGKQIQLQSAINFK